LLSIDILLGVSCSYLFATVLLESDLPALVPLILCIAVWLIYTLDHLSDAWFLGGRALKPVYAWHWERRRILLVFSAVLAATAVLLSFLYLPAKVLLAGLAGSGFLMLYGLFHSLLANRGRYFFKELWVGGIYTIGVWGLPFLFRGVRADPAIFMILAAFFCLVMVNVLTYSLFELPLDRQENLPTFAVRYGYRSCRNLIRGFLIISLVLSSACLCLHGPATVRIKTAGILLVMSFLLGIIHIFPGYFGKHGRFGRLADAVFILPAVIVLF
jgi:4-hydroxybenzoate polyprenyltransferase